MNENERYVSENLEELIKGLEPKSFTHLQKLLNYEYFVKISKEEKPNLTDEEIDFQYAMLSLYGEILPNQDLVRKLQRFGKERPEMIKNLGDVVESNKDLRERYFKIIEEKAKNVPSSEKTLAQELGINVPKPEYSFDELVKITDQKYLGLTIFRKP
ncbi:MAG: hypothetical protein WC867_02155 [Candidatus Pacearchaeota archaeon]|jgi:hypothetical protein